MSDLLIRYVPDRIKRQLHARARENGRTVSDEAKSLLEKALAPEPEANLWDWMRNLVPPEYRGDDLVFEYRVDDPKPSDLKRDD
ncbi:MAG TPA: plasmid stabilization protein [Xanthobacteraceae bacterium]|jgi:plasmid stability protein